MTNQAAPMRPHAVLRSLALIAALAPLAVAGPINPPAGAVASTPGPEPRIAVNINNTPGDANSQFRIVAPGSYYLTGNVPQQTGRHGIEIASDNVVLDLMGFTVGSATGPATGLSGITSDGVERRAVTVRNGTIGWFTTLGVNIEGSGNIVEQLTVKDCGGTGVELGESCIIRGCTAVANGGTGLRVFEGSIIIDSVARENTFSGINAVRGTIARCSATDNGLDGISGSTASSISDCSASGNADFGISASSGTVVTNCSTYLNTIGGLESTGTGASFIGCGSFNNEGVGIRGNASSTIINCTVTGNATEGITAASRCTIRGNVCRGNGNTAPLGSGILVTGSNNHIEGNTCIDNTDHGIEVAGADNLIISNKCSENDAVEYSIAVGNRIGTILIPSQNAAAVSGSTYAAGLGTTDPWANFSY